MAVVLPAPFSPSSEKAEPPDSGEAVEGHFRLETLANFVKSNDRSHGDIIMDRQSDRNMSSVPAGLAVNQKVIVITGAAGFLGSALTVDLSRDHCVVAIDRRKPSDVLLTAACQTRWHQVDIADSEALARTFQHARQSLGRVDVVLHFAAFYHFGSRLESGV